MEDKIWVKEFSKELSKELNDQYKGIIDADKIENYIKKLQESNISREEIITIINSKKEEVITEYKDNIHNNNRISQELHYNLNELFDCRITDNTLHIHVVPKSVKEDLAKIGHKDYLIYAEEMLMDAFEKIRFVIKEPDNININTIFAVSPLLKVKVLQKMFQKYNFEVSMSDNPYFIEMFKTTGIGQAAISREDFLTMLEDRNNGDDNKPLDGNKGTSIK